MEVNGLQSDNLANGDSKNQQEEKKRYPRFPVPYQQSILGDIKETYGAGVSSYFYILRQYASLFIILTIVYFPTLFYCFQGNAINGENRMNLQTLTVANFQRHTNIQQSQLDDVITEAQIIIITDFISCLLFLALTYWMRYQLGKELDEIQFSTISIKEWAVEVVGFPNYVINEQDITTHFEGLFAQVYESKLARDYKGTLLLQNEKNRINNLIQIQLNRHQLLGNSDQQDEQQQLEDNIENQPINLSADNDQNSKSNNSLVKNKTGNSNQNQQNVPPPNNFNNENQMSIQREEHIQQLKLKQKEIQYQITSHINTNLQNDDLQSLRAYVVFADIQTKQYILKLYNRKICGCAPTVEELIAQRKILVQQEDRQPQNSNIVDDSKELNLQNQIENLKDNQNQMANEEGKNQNEPNDIETSPINFRDIYPLQVKEAEDPAVYQWENLDTPMIDRFEKFMYSIFLSLIFIFPTLSLVYLSHQFSYIDPESCLRYNGQSTNDLNQCLCTNSYYSYYLNSSNKNCSKYEEKVAMNTSVDVGFGIAVCLSNFFLRIGLQFVIKRQCFENLQKENQAIMKRVLISQFINVVFIVLFFTSNIYGFKLSKWTAYIIPPLYDYELQNESRLVSDLGRAWYLNVGRKIISVSFFNIFIPSLFFLVGSFIFQWYNETGRGQSTNQMIQIRKQLTTQSGNSPPEIDPKDISIAEILPDPVINNTIVLKDPQEQANSNSNAADQGQNQELRPDSIQICKNPPFTLNAKFSQLLVTIFINQIVSGGIPISQIFCASALFIQYWVDKYLLFRYNSFDQVQAYRLQANDIEQGIYVLRVMPLAVVFHLCFSIVSYGTPGLLPDFSDFGFSMESLSSNQDFLVLYKAGRFFLLTFLLILVMLLIIFDWVGTYYEEKENKIEKQFASKVETKNYKQKIVDSSMITDMKNNTSFDEIQQSISNGGMLATYDLKESEKYRDIVLLFDKFSTESEGNSTIKKPENIQNSLLNLIRKDSAPTQVISISPNQ